MKPWYQSRTILYNGVVLVAAILAAVLAFVGDLQASGVAISAGTVAMLVSVDKFINILLRFLTNAGIGKE